MPSEPGKRRAPRAARAGLRREPAPIGPLLAAALALALAWGFRSGAPPGAAAQSEPEWRALNAGLAGGRVTELLLLGDGPSSERAMLVLIEGRHLHRSIDGGRSWDATPLAGSAQAPELSALLSAPEDPTGRLLYAGLRSAPSLAVSTDAGLSWQLRGGPLGVDAFDHLAVRRDGRLYASWGYLPGRVTVSDDGGASWSWQDLAEPCGDGEIRHLITDPAGGQALALVGKVLCRSVEGSDLWESMGTVDPLEPEGRNWLVAAPGGRLYYALAPEAGPARLRIRGGDEPGWRDASLPAAARLTALGAGGPAEGGTRLCAGFDTGEVFCSQDDAASWQLQIELPVMPLVIAIDPEDGLPWLGTHGLGLRRPGAPPQGPSPELLDVVEVLAPDPARGDLAWALARLPRPDRAEPPEALLLRSVDGQAWQPVGEPRAAGGRLLASPDFDRDGRLYAGPLRSSDGGQSWEPFAPTSADKRPFVAAVGAISGTHALLLALEAPYVDGEGGAGLLESRDGGDSWRRLDVAATGIIDVAIARDDPVYHSRFLLTDRGLVLRSELDEDFEPIGRLPTELPLQGAYDLLLSPRYAQDLTLLAVAEQRVPPDRLSERAQVFVSRDGGSSWSPRLEGLIEGARPRALWISPDFDLDGRLLLGGAREPRDAALPAIFGASRAEPDWRPEALLPPGAEVRGFALGGRLEEGRLYAAAGPAGVWLRDLEADPLPTRTVTPTARPRPSSTPRPSPTAVSTAGPPASPSASSAPPSPSITPAGDPSPTPVPPRTTTATATVPTAPAGSPSPTRGSPAPGPGARILLPFVTRR